MSEYENMRTADIVAEALLDWKVDIIFGLPGDGINGFIEALRRRQDRIKFVLVRHEESAAFMACAYAKYTGKLGACVATSGPGAIHLLNGLYDAKADNTPVIAITGTTYSDLMNSSYQQDVNLLQLYSDVAVYNGMISVPEQAEMAVDIACRTALAQRGVSHLTIPIDVHEKKLSSDKYSRHNIVYHTSDVYTVETIPSQSLIKEAVKILNNGSRVVILVGQGAVVAAVDVIAVAEKLGTTIVKALLGKAVIPDDSPYTTGGIGLLGTSPSSDTINEADTLLMIGTSFPYIDYLPKPGQARGIQIDIKPEKIGLRYPVEVGLLGDSRIILSALIPLLDSHNKGQKENKNSNNSFLLDKQQAMKEWTSKLETFRNRSNNSGEITYNNKLIKPQTIAAAVSEELEDNAIISIDSGTSTFWAARHINVRNGMKFSVSGTLASMACGLPYAIAAQMIYPERQCVAFVGDGGFMMLMAEFATAVQYNLPIKVIILKNNTLGMIRWEQMGYLGNPEYGVEFTPIDLAGFAKNCGGNGYTIKKSEDIRPVMKMAMHKDTEKKPVIIEAYVDPLEPMVPPKAKSEFIQKISESFAKGQPYSERIGLTLYRNKFETI